MNGHKLKFQIDYIFFRIIPVDKANEYSEIIGFIWFPPHIIFKNLFRESVNKSITFLDSVVLKY